MGSKETSGRRALHLRDKVVFKIVELETRFLSVASALLAWEGRLDIFGFLRKEKILNLFYLHSGLKFEQ